MQKRANLYIDGKRVRRKDLQLRGLDYEIRRLKKFYFPLVDSVSADYPLPRGRKLTIEIVSFDRKKKK